MKRTDNKFDLNIYYNRTNIIFMILIIKISLIIFKVNFFNRDVEIGDVISTLKKLLEFYFLH